MKPRSTPLLAAVTEAMEPAPARAAGRAAVPSARKRTRAPFFPRWIRWTTKAVALLTLGAVSAFAAGFVMFAIKVSAMEPEPTIGADGIVVLTGGSERVSGALDLLSEGAARRLLISGVHPDTSARQIGKVVDAGPNLFDCCVDLDRRAANTIGNAVETAKWTRAHAFKSLIVVTSAYHMPRALAELAHAMPDVTLRPYPVAKDKLALDRWYENGETTSLLLQEYVKYIATRARLSLAGGNAVPAVLATVAK